MKLGCLWTGDIYLHPEQGEDEDEEEEEEEERHDG